MYQEISKLIMYGNMDKDCILYKFADIFRRFEMQESSDAQLTQDIYTTTNQKLAASWGKEIDLLVTWLYRLTSEQYNYKMASVIGICVFVVCAVITLFAFNFLIKGDKEDTFR